MKNYCILLALIFSVSVSNATKLHHSVTKAVNPTNSQIEITAIKGKQVRDVGVGADGTIWIISNEPDGTPGYSLYKWVPGATDWKQVGGRGGRVSVAKNGLAWMVQNDYDIFMHNGKNWTQVNGKGTDVSCSPDGNVFLVGTDKNNYMLKRNSLEWQKIEGANGATLAGGNSQSLWAINDKGDVSRLTPVGWEVVGSNGVDIAVGKDGSTWLLTNAEGPNQFMVFDESLQDWVVPDVAGHLATSGVKVSSSPTIRIAVAPNGDLLGVRKDFSLYRMKFVYNTN